MSGICFHLWINGSGTAWIAGGFLAAGALFFIVHLVPDAYALRLDSKGFDVSEMFTNKRYAWSNVSEFGIRRGFLGHYVDFEYVSPDTDGRQRVVLNESYGFKPVEMVQLLNGYREQAAATVNKAAGKNVWRSRNC